MWLHPPPLFLGGGAVGGVMCLCLLTLSFVDFIARLGTGASVGRIAIWRFLFGATLGACVFASFLYVRHVEKRQNHTF